MPSPLVLASSSPSRVAILRAAGLAFEQAPARIDEAAIRAALAVEGATPRDMADALAEFKALKISERHPASLVIGSDQVLDFEGVAMAKADTAGQAREQLLRLRGRRHSLFSAAVIAQGGKPIWRHVGEARLTMRMFSDDYLDAYLARNWPAVAGCVGCYQIESEGIRLFSRVDGAWPVILGMPLVEILGYLADRGEIAS
jgi:septum formation protein